MIKNKYIILLTFFGFLFSAEIADFLKTDKEIKKLEQEINDSGDHLTLYLYEFFSEGFRDMSSFQCRYGDIKYVSSGKIKILGEHYEIPNYIHTNYDIDYSPNQIVEVFVLFNVVFSIQQIDDVEFMLDRDFVSQIIIGSDISNMPLKADDYFIHIDNRYSHVIPEYFEFAEPRTFDWTTITIPATGVFAVGTLYYFIMFRKNAEEYSNSQTNEAADYYKSKYKNNKKNMMISLLGTTGMVGVTLYFELDLGK